MRSMRKFLCKNQKWIPYIALFMLAAFFCWLFVCKNGVFGSKVDWISQHSVLPDYFRQQFYETGDFFPEFALNIGGGQNIYNFAYYGLYSPLIFPAYLFPFVKMSDYIMGMQFICLTASAMLMYGWLGKRGFSRGISFWTAVMFLLSGPMIYHSYNQIMFVNYMPFLLTGLMGVDRYFESPRRRGLLTVSLFLMIMASFYFSIGGMLVLILYGIHRYIEKYSKENKKVALKIKLFDFLKEGVCFLVPFFTGILMSALLLLPTAMALTGREAEGKTIDVASLLCPGISLDRFFYSPYGIGLTTLVVTALVSMMFFRKWHERVLAWSCVAVLTVPVFAYLLNGGLYVRDKVMIPFLPLLCYIIAVYLREAERGKLHGGYMPYVVSIMWIYLGRLQGDVGKYWNLLLIDGVLMLVCFLAFCRKKNVLLLIIPVVLCLAVFGLVLNKRADRTVSRQFYEEAADGSLQELTAKTAKAEEGFYRMEQLGTDQENAANLNRIHDMRQYVSSVYSSSYNTEYQRFRQDTFQLEMPFRNFLMQSAVYNPVYQRFMGVKYVITREGKEWKVHENENVSPIAYATDEVTSQKEYEKLEFPYNQLELLSHAVIQEVEQESANHVSADCGGHKDYVQPVDIELPRKIVSKENQTVKTDIPNMISGENGKVLFLQFCVKNRNPGKDVAIWLEGVRNKLTDVNHFYYNGNTTFSYAVRLAEGQQKIEIKFGKGRYEIADVRCYVAELPDDSLYQSVFHVDKGRTKGNVVSGTIQTEKDGYFITTIPYDENFEIRIDGKKTRIEKVNTAFLGCRIEGGQHKIEIVYHAPGATAGKVMSALGILLSGVMLWQEKRERHLL